jgi:hypothetical protein
MKRRGTVYFNKHVNESQAKGDIKKVISKWIELCNNQTPPLGIQHPSSLLSLLMYY